MITENLHLKLTTNQGLRKKGIHMQSNYIIE